MKKLLALLLFLSIPAHAELVTLSPGATGSGGGPLVDLGTSSAATNPQRPGQVNTGLFSNASNAVGVSNGGVVSLNATQVGVAIGTSAVPANTLDVYGGTGIAVGTYAGTTATATGGLVASGSVGIGTNTPTSALQIVGGIETLPLGAAGTPSLVPAGSTSTGMWFPSTTTIAWSSAGTEVMRIGANNNVMINTTSPISGAILNVSGPTAVPYSTILVSTGNFTYNTIMGEGFFTSADCVYLQPAGNNAANATATYFCGTSAGGNGSIGIGSSIPRGVLDLSQNTGAMLLPIGTTTQEPSPGVNGMVRYNTTKSATEAYVNNAWYPMIQTTVVASSTGASPEVATCAAGYVLTGCSCVDATVADACSAIPVGGLAGTCTATSGAGNVTAYAVCAH